VDATLGTPQLGQRHSGNHSRRHGDWGVGIRSLRDRAEELGGTASVGPVTDGWTVHAQLPLHH
jgi:signal transduction histidine kinase